nr:serine/threonine-protein kinase atm [Quercus suber]
MRIVGLCKFALVSLVKKMAIDHPYNTIFQVYKLYSFRWSEAYYRAYGKSLLRAILGHANWKEPSILNEWGMIPWLHWTRLSSNFGVTLVVSSKEKLVTAREVLAAGPQPQPTLVTVILTLMHMAIYSEELDLEGICQCSTS